MGPRGWGVNGGTVTSLVSPLLAEPLCLQTRDGRWYLQVYFLHQNRNIWIKGGDGSAWAGGINSSLAAWGMERPHGCTFQPPHPPHQTSLPEQTLGTKFSASCDT